MCIFKYITWHAWATETGLKLGLCGLVWAWCRTAAGLHSNARCAFYLSSHIWRASLLVQGCLGLGKERWGQCETAFSTLFYASLLISLLPPPGYCNPSSGIFRSSEGIFMYHWKFLYCHLADVTLLHFHVF